MNIDSLTNFMLSVSHQFDTLMYLKIFEGYRLIAFQFHNVIFLCALLYIIFFGYKIIFKSVHGHHIIISSGVHVIILILALQFSQNWAIFVEYFYGIFVHIASMTAQALSGQQNAGFFGNITVFLSLIVKSIHQIENSNSGILADLYILLLFILFCIFTACVIFQFLVARLIFAILSILAPLMFICILFTSLRPLFSRWVSEMISATAVPVFLSIALYIFGSIFNDYLQRYTLEGHISIEQSLPVLIILLISNFSIFFIASRAWSFGRFSF